MPIINAVMKNNTARLVSLLRNGADPNFTEDYAGITPLHYAAQYDSLEAATLLMYHISS